MENNKENTLTAYHYRLKVVEKENRKLRKDVKEKDEIIDKQAREIINYKIRIAELEVMHFKKKKEEDEESEEETNEDNIGFEDKKRKREKSSYKRKYVSESEIDEEITLKCENW